MAITNHERVGKALDLLNTGLKPFVERELQAAHGERWQDVFRDRKPAERGREKKGESVHLDAHALLAVMWDQWNLVFQKTLGQAERSLVSELRDARNRWAHQKTFSGDDAYRTLDSVSRLLTAVSAEEAAEIEKQKMELMRIRFDEQRRNETRKAAVAPVEGRPAGNLKPWREVITPHPDVASGRFQQAEFAADLWQVYKGEGSDEYKNPTEFFRRTYITEGIKNLLAGALRRLGGSSGDPVVDLQTNFGGGKTHSMLALYHMFSGVSPAELPGIEPVLQEAEVPMPTGVHRAVLVGTKISPGQPRQKPDGTVVRTLWGELAWQLDKKVGYEIVRQADETATNPGEALEQLLRKYSPCLILIDEWVAYARQLHDGSNLPGGTFETQFTFAQALSEAAKTVPNTLLAVSIPASEAPRGQLGEHVSDIEVGGERGRQALARLKNAIGRVGASWRPATPDEGFEIVRRRLFQPITDNMLFVARDQTARSFVEMYGDQQQEFPLQCREADYERRIKAAYPIHPELFDRLFDDWSTLEKFQRTRGVLRLMASVIHCLWERQDSNSMIMPATVPIDDPQVQFELTRYLDDQWVPVIEKDVDGVRSLPLSLDRDNPNLGRYSACRRVARTIYLGSAPTQRAANRGLEERHVKLGCVQPGESVATFGDALRRLTDRATYLYVDGKRYWYSTQASVTRLAEDRAHQQSEDAVVTEIERRLREEARSRGDFPKVQACVSSADVTDEREVRLVILGPEYPNMAKEPKSPARTQAAAILDSRGSSPRTYRNTLVFLAADATRLKELDEAVRLFLAWKSIWDEHEALNLDQAQSKQAETKRGTADETMKARIPETYQWLIVPGQSDPKGDIEWTEIKLQGQESLAARASKKLKNEELFTVQFGGARLRHELDRIPLWRGNDVCIKQLAEDVAKYLYLPRLRDEDVLLAAIRDGLARATWQADSFAYAEAWDEQKQRYVGLRGGTVGRILIDATSRLVKPDVAAEQIKAEQSEQDSTAGATGGITDTGTSFQSTDHGHNERDLDGGSEMTRGGTIQPAPQRPRRFHGSVKLDSLRSGFSASKVADEVIKHLTSIVGANVEVTLEIHAEIPDGVSPEVVRIVTENCRTLRFDSQGFEES